jgi:hypothetical protein
LTALVGANPNTDGCYSRSLNRMFRDVTGFPLLAEPHREADRVALGIARSWTGFDPLFSLGLLATKAERLLVHERALLYWPLFRAGVLPEGQRGFFAGHQAGIEAIADGYWLVILFLALMGVGLALARRDFLALALVPQAAILAGLYTAIFSEPRYRLPIAMLLLPLAAQAAWWVTDTLKGLARRQAPASWRREAIIAGGLALGVFVLAPLATYAGTGLRERHRWAVHECSIAGRPRFCAWRPVENLGPGTTPAILGVWNGLGISVSGRAVVAAETDIDLPAGSYLVSAKLDVATGGGTLAAALSVLADGQPLAAPLALAKIPVIPSAPVGWLVSLEHRGGPLRLQARLESKSSPSASGRIWLTDIRLDRFADRPAALSK